MKSLFSYLLLLIGYSALCQFAPPDGQPGSTAMHQDSSAFKGWAQAAHIQRGFQDISDTSLGYTTIGDSLSCLGKANNMVVSLGDGGEAIISVPNGIYDGPGWDFAVFENSFVNNFLELAFVEVSSDGLNYYRFPAASLTPDTIQIGPFDFIDATKINNLAGKYRGTFGTPFDLSELNHHPGLDLSNISYIKIIDVVGSIDPQYARYDTADNPINDPWPTPFPSSGFDLDAVGFIHLNAIGLEERTNLINVYPNPAKDFIRINASNWTQQHYSITILDLRGQTLIRETATGKGEMLIPTNNLIQGHYLLQLKSKEKSSVHLIQVVR